MARPKLIAAAVAFATLLAGPATVRAEPVITVETMRWGLAGFLAERTFNPVQIEIRNDGDEPFDGAIEIGPVAASRLSTGRLAHRREVYLGPGQTRTVGFTVFLRQDTVDWTLTPIAADGEPLPTAPLDPVIFPNADAVGIAQIAAEGDRTAGVARLRPEEVPTKATAMSMIAGLIIGTDITLQATQSDALIDWVRSGGLLIVAQTPTGETPKLPGELVRLATPGETRPIGRGVVRSMGERAIDLDREEIRWFVARRRRQELTAVEKEQLRIDMQLQAEQAAAFAGGPPIAMGAGSPDQMRFAFDADTSIVGNLEAAMRSPTFGPLFVPMAAAYFAALVSLSVVCRRRKWRWPRYFAALFALVAVATVALIAASPITSNIRPAAVTVVLAAPLRSGESSGNGSEAYGEAGQVLVRQWESRFSGLGGSTTVTARGDQQVIAVEGPAVQATVAEGPQQTLDRAEPPLTTSLVRAAGLVSAPPPDLIVDARVSGPELTGSVRSRTGTLPPADHPLALLLFGSQYALLLNDDGVLRPLTLDEVREQNEARFGWGLQVSRNYSPVWTLSPITFQRRDYRGQNPFSTDFGPLSVDERLLDVLPLVPVADRRMTGSFSAAELTQPAGQCTVLLPAPLDERTDLLGESGGGSRTGMTVWIIRLPQDVPMIRKEERGPIE